MVQPRKYKEMTTNKMKKKILHGLRQGYMNTYEIK